MLDIPEFRLDDTASVRALIREHPWVRIISATETGPLVVSHLPVILDPDADDVVLLGHLARTDADEHALGSREVVVIVEGPHGYVSPSFYQAGPYVPTWNFEVAHLHGRPEVLDGPATYDVLDGTVDHFESRRPEPWQLASVREYADSLVPHVTGFRLRPTRVVAKSKMSQDKPPEVLERVATALENDPHHGDPALAARVRRHQESA